MKNFLLLFSISLMLLGCAESPYLEEGDKIVLQDRFGHFISADRHGNGELIPDREKIRNWEYFKVQSVKEGKFTLSDFENNPIYLHKKRLQWDKNATAANFRFEASKGRIFLKTGDDKFLRSNSKYVVPSKNTGIIIHRLGRKNVLGGYLDNEDVIMLFLALGIFIFLILNQLYGWYSIKSQILYSLLLIAHFSVAFFAITQFDFLFYWDEMFHAVVAKNLSIDPTIPKLFNPACHDPSLGWGDTDVWLHKQPLFLYQMAAAIKVFGVNAISPRIPSLLMMTLAGLLTYRIGSQLFNKLIGLIGSMIFCFSLHKIELLFGMRNTDHNDLAFLFYVTSSFWALIEYRISHKKWAFAGIFIFAACAVLTKWLLGFLVYYTWGMILLLSFTDIKAFLKELKPLLISFTFSLLLVIPWQVYIFSTYPEIASFEISEIKRHFSEVVEDHYGNWDYHLLLSMKHYGLHYYLLIIAPFIAYFSSNRKKLFTALLISVITVYVFYSIAETKMVSFTFVVSVLICVIIAAAMENLYRSLLHFHPNKEKVIKPLFLTSLLFLIYHSFDPVEIERKMNPKLSHFKYVQKEITQKKFKRLSHDIKAPSVLFNATWPENINAMYYNENLPVYPAFPDFERLKEPPCDEREILVFDDGSVPDSVATNPRARLIPNY